MSNFDLQGELDVFSEKQIRLVRSVLEKKISPGSKILITPLGKADDNYGSNVKLITARQDDGKTLKIIAKVAPTSEYLRASMNVGTLFGNESLMYGKVLPKFRQLQIEADIPEENRFKFPLCYGILEEPLHEIILLEDLRESNFVMGDRLKSLTDEEVRVIFNSFAELHSLSFVLKKKDPATYEEYTTKLTEYFSSSSMAENVKNGFNLIENTILQLFDADRYKAKIKGSLSNISHEALKLHRCDAGSRYSVITHGDSWTNNILLKLNEHNIVEECMLIDYQLSAERSPVSDLLYLVFSSTDYETRSKHYNEWMDAYHENLVEHLSHYGIKADYVYPKEKMLADLHRYSKLFLGWSIIMANMFCMDTEGAAQLKNAMDTSKSAEEMMENFKMDSVDSKVEIPLKTKIQGIIDSYYDLGYCS